MEPPKRPRVNWEAHIERIRPVFMVLLAAVGVLLLGGGGLVLADQWTRQALLEHYHPVAVLIDLPKPLENMADVEILAQVKPLLGGPWLEGDLCRRVAEKVAGSAWVEELRSVRLRPDARIEIACRYRLPFVMVDGKKGYFMLDEHGVRLPGLYGFYEAFPMIYGGTGNPPEPGAAWPGEDVLAGLEIWRLIQKEPFAGQISAVLVDNFEGRRNPRECHLELATRNTPGGRILWGSRIGQELKEPTAEEKLSLLRGNFASTGRVDAGFKVIDISVFGDSFIVRP